MVALLFFFAVERAYLRWASSLNCSLSLDSSWASCVFFKTLALVSSAARAAPSPAARAAPSSAARAVAARAAAVGASRTRGLPVAILRLHPLAF